MRRLEYLAVRSRRMNNPFGALRDSSQQLAQENRAHTAKDDHRPGLPHQSVDELVKLRRSHAQKSSTFPARIWSAFSELVSW
jgi:hypothetical protein